MKMMRKSFIGLFVAFLATFSLLCYAQESKWNANTQIGARASVEKLLIESGRFWHDPATVSNAGYTGKLPSNTEAIADHLQKAIVLAPYRYDLRMALGNDLILQKKVSEAIATFKKVADATDSSEAKANLALWYDYQHKTKESKRYLGQLGDSKGKIQDVLKSVHKGLATPLIDKASKIKGKHTAIVLLGYGLSSNGTMKPVLVSRLEKALEAIKLNPKALVVVTGGVPKKGWTESIHMKQWLIQKGVDEHRIIGESYARSTVGNAQFSVPILKANHIDHAVIVSSASHVQRAYAVFDVVSKTQGGDSIAFSTLAYPDKSLKEVKDATPKNAIHVYRDALRSAGYFLFNAYPFVDQ